MSALPAFSADARRIGSARALSAWVCGPSPVSATVLTPISLPALDRRLHLDDRERRDRRRADRGARARRASFGAAVAGGGLQRRVRVDRARRLRVVAGQQHDGDGGDERARRATFAHQNANRSVTMWRRDTPVRARLARVASVIAGGPQT